MTDCLTDPKGECTRTEDEGRKPAGLLSIWQIHQQVDAQTLFPSCITSSPSLYSCTDIAPCFHFHPLLLAAHPLMNPQKKSGGHSPS